MYDFKIIPYKIKGLSVEKIKCENCGQEKNKLVWLRVAIEDWNSLTKSKEIRNKTYKVCEYCLNWLTKYYEEHKQNISNDKRQIMGSKNE